MGISSSMDIAATGLTAQRLRMDVISSNLANVDTTRTPAGGPYRRNRVVFAAAPPLDAGSSQMAPRLQSVAYRSDSAWPPTPASSGGVVVSGMSPDPTPFKVTYDPTHPDADAQGNVAYPNVDVTTEMTDMLSATRAYEANVTVVNASKAMALKALDIGRG